MKLESLLKPAKWIDKQILKQYTKLGQKIPTGNMQLYKVTTALHFMSYLGIAYWHHYVSGINAFVAGISTGLFISGADYCLNMDGLDGKLKDTQESEEKIAPTFYGEDFKEYNRGIRLPVFLVGVGFAGKVGYDLFRYFKNKEHVNFSETISAGRQSVSFLALASSMYLKDQDPKLLKKNPFWKKAKDWIKEKVDSLTPKPVPPPVPIHIDNHYKTIGDFL